MKRLLAVMGCLTCLVFSAHLWAVTAFHVKAIHVKGLTHTSEATVLSYTPLQPGEQLTAAKADQIVHDLYQTGFFSTISLSQEGQDLVISVSERPLVSKIVIDGEEEVKKEQVEQILEKIGLTKGQPYQPSLLKKAETTLQKSYAILGLYGAKVSVVAEHETAQTVDIAIHIHEGEIAAVKHIRLIGNHAFKDEKLLKVFSIGTSHFWSPLFHDDRFSPEKMHADLEALRSFYYNHGYLDFRIVSSKVSLSPDGEGVFVTVHLEEGQPYRIRRLAVTGKMPAGLKADDLKHVVITKEGMYFSRQALSDDITHMKASLANRGHAFADVSIHTKLDRKAHTVDVDLQVLPGHVIYVRQVTFTGNTLTADYVLRRAARQYEGARFSYHDLEESKRRLKNLGYVDQVAAKVVPVPGSPDKVDLAFSMKEKASAQFNFQVGYSQAFGLLYGVNWQQANALGSGNDFSISLQRSQYQSSANISYFNPYFTQSGISQDVGFSFHKTTPEKVDLSDYRMDSASTYLQYGIPLTEYQRVGLGVSLEQLSLHTNANTPSQITNFVNNNGDDFRQVGVNVSWGYNNLDQAIFPTKGWRHNLGVQVSNSIGDDDLHYFTSSYHVAWYQPVLSSSWVLHARGNVRYGDGFSETNDLPPFRHFYAGGIGSVTGYEPNGLGPKDSNGRPLGGSVAVDGSVGVVIPASFSEQARYYLFADAGNVYQDKLDLGQLRYSVGIGLTWKMMLPLQFAIAKAINPGSQDETRLFDFTIGTSF